MSKGKGWDNDEHRRNEKKLGEAYKQFNNVKEFKKQPYDPAKEVVVAKIGSIAFKADGPHLHVEISSYDGKFEGVVLSQKQGDREKKFWKLRSQQVEELSALLAQAARTLKEREDAAQEKREAEREQVRLERERERRDEQVRKIVGRR